MENVKRWAPVFGYAALIFYMSSKAGDDIPSALAAYDKVMHTLEFAGLGFLLARALGERRWWWAIVLATLYGVLDEYHQSFVPGRYGNDLGDMTADLVGATLGAAGWRFVFTRLLRAWAPDGTKGV